MIWQWPILYVCAGLIMVLITDDNVQDNDPDNPMGTRVLMAVFWPVVVVAVLGYAAWYLFDDEGDDDQGTGW